MLSLTTFNLMNKNCLKNYYSYKFLNKKPNNSQNHLSDGFYLNFGKMYENQNYTLQGQIKKLEVQECPSERIIKLANKILKEDPNTKKTIYDVHNEYYAPLLNCSTLEEAKALYPEFSDVIDAKNLDLNNAPFTIQRISKGKIEGLDIENLTLRFLQQYYGKAGSIKKKEDFFGLALHACNKIFEALNIKKIAPYYLHLYSTSSPEHRKKMSEMRYRIGASEEYKKSASISQKKSYNSEKGAERRKKISEGLKKSWNGPDKERIETHREKINATIRRPENRQRASERTKKLWQDPEFAESVLSGMRNFYDNNPDYREIKSKAWHANEDIIEIMQNTLKDCPYMYDILAKTRKGVPLSKDEEISRRLYLEECKRRCPDMFKRVNKTFSEMWTEYKKEKGKENKK